MKVMRTTIRMNPDLARRAKEFAERTGTTFTDVVETAVSEHLARRSEQSARPRRAVKLPVSKARGKALNHQQVKAAMDQADFEYDLKKLGAA